MGLTAGEDRGSVRAGQVTYLAPDRTDLRGLTAVQTLTLIEYRATHRLFLYIVIVTVHERSYLIDIDAECFCAGSHIICFLRLEIFADLREHILAVVLVGVGAGSLCISTSVRIVVHCLLQLVVIHLVAVFAFSLFTVRFHHLVDSQTLRFDRLVCSLDGLEHNGLRHLFHLTLNHHDVVVRSGNHQLEVRVLALLEGRVNHHFSIYTCYAYFAHRTLKRDIRTSQCCTGSESCNRLRHVDAVCRIHRNVHEGLGVVVSREQRTEGTVNESCNQNLVVRCFAFAAGKASGETTRRSKLLFVLYRQGHKIGTGHCVFGRADGSQNHRVAQSRHDSAVSLFG